MELSGAFASLSFMSTGVSVRPRELLVCTGSRVFSVHASRTRRVKSEGRCAQRVSVSYYKHRLHCLLHLYAVVSSLLQLIESPIRAKGRQPYTHILL